MPSRAYDFRAMSAADLPLLRRWLAAPHVMEWWGAPTEEFALLSGDLAEPAIEQYIVSTDAPPFAYLQCYDLVAFPDCAMGAQPAVARDIDQLISEPDPI